MIHKYAFLQETRSTQIQRSGQEIDTDFNSKKTRTYCIKKMPQIISTAFFLYLILSIEPFRLQLSRLSTHRLI